MIEQMEFAKVLAMLAALYPRFRLEKETTRAYYAILGDLPVDLLKAAALQIGSEPGPWFPSAGDLRAKAMELIECQQGLPTAGEAWAEALKRIDYYNPPKAEDFSHPAVFDALEAIGGNRVLCTTMEDALMATRAHFFKAYEALTNRQRMQMAMLPVVRETVQALAGNNIPQLGDGDNGK